mmetsp:Transcript_7002/g.14025  ORF Transcript_7002/g.14025 Transcript_7002/m.14025 type:complete len:184 (+) Transcript_7002:20-571(+)
MMPSLASSSRRLRPTGLPAMALALLLVFFATFLAVPAAAEAGIDSVSGLSDAVSSHSSSAAKARSNCDAVSACERCSAEDLKWAATDPTCLGTGYKQEYLCQIRKRVNDDSCDGTPGAASAHECGYKVEEVNVFFACDPPVASAGDDVMYFEFVMIIGAVGALYVVWQRKIQAHERLSSILSN